MSNGDYLSAVIMIIAVVGGYFLPTLIAIWNQKQSQNSIFVVNLFLGWTFIGWVVALAMAASRDPKTR